MSNPKNILREACRSILRPFASMLLRCGMTWKEFSDLSKSVFVEVATAEFGIKNRPTNVSRVSILTGIDRKEVKRQRELMAVETPAADGKTTDATRVLSAWFQDSDYLDADSNPVALAEQGQNPSFVTLCAQYGGDIAATTLLKELLTTNTIEKDANGELRPLRRYYQPAVSDDENLKFAAQRIRELFETMNNNVFPSDKHAPIFGGYAANDMMSAEIIPKYREFLDKRGQEFLEEIDDWLTEHAPVGEGAVKNPVRMGIGLYAIEQAAQKEGKK